MSWQLDSSSHRRAPPNKARSRRVRHPWRSFWSEVGWDVSQLCSAVKNSDGEFEFNACNSGLANSVARNLQCPHCTNEKAGTRPSLRALRCFLSEVESLCLDSNAAVPVCLRMDCLVLWATLDHLNQQTWLKSHASDEKSSGSETDRSGSRDGRFDRLQDSSAAS